MRRTSVALALCAVPYLALAQASGSSPPQQPTYQPAYPPQQPPPPPPQPQAQPQQGPPAAAPPPAASGTGAGATQPQAAGTGSGATQPQAAGTGAGAGGSQQVVVNPPAAQSAQPPAATGAAPSTAVNVNPAYGQYTPPVVVQQGEGRSSLEIVAIDAAYGALAGLLVGGGVALIANNDDWGRDLMIGTGAGILVGAAVGGIHAYNVSNSGAPRYSARDGLGTPDRNPPLSARTLVGYAGRF